MKAVSSSFAGHGATAFSGAPTLSAMRASSDWFSFLVMMCLRSGRSALMESIAGVNRSVVIRIFAPELPKMNFISGAVYALFVGTTAPPALTMA